MPLADAAAAEAIANQLADEADAIAIEAGPEVNFVYYGWMERGDVPEDVTHVRIDSSVRAIKENLFGGCEQLRIVILNEELEEIGVRAFGYCESMEDVDATVSAASLHRMRQSIVPEWNLVIGDYN